MSLRLRRAFKNMAFDPVVLGGAPLDAVDEYREYYYSDGGERLEQIVNEWRTDS